MVWNRAVALQDHSLRPAAFGIGLVSVRIGGRLLVDLQSVEIVLGAEVSHPPTASAVGDLGSEGSVIDETRSLQSLDDLERRLVVDVQRRQPFDEFGSRSATAGNQPEHPLLCRVDVGVPIERRAGLGVDEAADRESKGEHSALVHPTTVAV